MLSTEGAPLMPAGGSVCRRLKSRISLRFAGVVISQLRWVAITAPGLCLRCLLRSNDRRAVRWAGHNQRLIALSTADAGRKVRCFRARCPLSCAGAFLLANR